MKRRNLFGLAALTALPLVGCSALESLEEGGGGTGGGSGEGGDLIPINLGYLHTLAVDDKLQLGIEKGYFAEEGVDLKLTQFDTGIAASQALSGGSVDVALMGAVMTNVAAKKQGKIFLLNAIEHDTAQLWVQPDSGIESIEDLRGKKVITTEGTTADIFLMRALDAAGMDRSELSVVNAGMANAVQAFASGSVDAIALWVPFDLRVVEAVPEAKLVDSAKNYPDAAILSGWMANNAWHDENRDAMQRMVRGWLRSNEEFMSDQAQALKVVQEAAYTGEVSLEDLEHQSEFQTNFTNEEWLEKYESGEALEMLGTVVESFVGVGALEEAVDPSELLDPSIFVEAAEGQ